MISITKNPTGKLKLFTYTSDSLADDGIVSLPNATSGMCFITCNAEAIMAIVLNTGQTDLVSNTVNTANTDSDTNLCIYDGGTNAIVKNRLGTTGEIRIFYYYN